MVKIVKRRAALSLKEKIKIIESAENEKLSSIASAAKFGIGKIQAFLLIKDNRRQSGEWQKFEY